MFKRLFVCILLGALLCLSCSDDDEITAPEQITGSGDLVTFERTLTGFHSVALITVGNVTISEGDEQSVTITVDDNLRDYLKTDVSGGVLRIDFDDAIDPQDFELSLELVMTDLQTLSLTGVGSFTGRDEFAVDSVNLSVTGVGNISLSLDAGKVVSTMTGVGSITLTGTADILAVTHSGVGHLAAFGLVADTVRIVSTGVGDAEIYAEDYLDVTITGVGSVYYKGSPTIDDTITGLGQLINAN